MRPTAQPAPHKNKKNKYLKNKRQERYKNRIFAF